MLECADASRGDDRHGDAAVIAEVSGSRSRFGAVSDPST